MISPDQIQDATFLRETTNWPNWPLCPLKRYPKKGGFPEHAILWDTQSGLIRLDIGLFDLADMNKADIAALVKNPVTIESVLADGWMVD